MLLEVSITASVSVLAVEDGYTLLVLVTESCRGFKCIQQWLYWLHYSHASSQLLNTTGSNHADSNPRVLAIFPRWHNYQYVVVVFVSAPLHLPNYNTLFFVTFLTAFNIILDPSFSTSEEVGDGVAITV